MKKLCCLILTLVLSVSLMTPFASAAHVDIPEKATLAAEVRKAINYGLMNGYSSKYFGYSDTMTRAQFLTVVGRMLDWFSQPHTAVNYITPEMEIPEKFSTTYREAVQFGVEYDVIDDDIPFRPSDAITRGEMAEILVRALGLKSAAAMVEDHCRLPFTDVTAGVGYIAIAYEIGMTKGTSSTKFSPDKTATRAQAAAMMVRIYEKLQQDTNWLHGFYALSSYRQIGFAESMDAVSAGWSRMSWNGTTAVLSTKARNNNEFFVPDGYEEVVKTMERYGTSLNLEVYMDLSGGIRDMLASEEGRSQAVALIIEELTTIYPEVNRNPYAGVTIDFEGLRAEQKENYTLFLQELAAGIHALNKTLYVCVSPVLTTGAYYDGYDYRAIGEVADKVILMAHDYDARSLNGFIGTTYYQTAAPVPMDQFYMSLRAVVDAEKGVQDKSKIVLAFSCKNIAWQIDENGRLLSPTPVYPSNETVYSRLNQQGTIHAWSPLYQNRNAIYETETGERWYLIYEDARSIQAKVDAARLLGITSTSVWRLGTIPDYNDWNWKPVLEK